MPALMAPPDTAKAQLLSGVQIAVLGRGAMTVYHVSHEEHRPIRCPLCHRLLTHKVDDGVRLLFYCYDCRETFPARASKFL